METSRITPSARRLYGRAPVAVTEAPSPALRTLSTAAIASLICSVALAAWLVWPTADEPDGAAGASRSEAAAAAEHPINNRSIPDGLSLGTGDVAVPSNRIDPADTATSSNGSSSPTEIPWSIAGLLSTGDASFLQSATSVEIAPIRVRKAISEAAASDALGPAAFAQLAQWLSGLRTAEAQSLLIALAAARELQPDHDLALATARQALASAHQAGQQAAVLKSALETTRLPLDMLDQLRNEAQGSPSMQSVILGALKDSAVTAAGVEATAMRNSVELATVTTMSAAIAQAPSAEHRQTILQALAVSPRADAIDALLAIASAPETLSTGELVAAAAQYGRSQLSGERINALHRLECTSGLSQVQRQLLASMRRSALEAGNLAQEGARAPSC